MAYVPGSTIKPSKVDLTLRVGSTFYPLSVLGGSNNPALNNPIDLTGWHFRFQISNAAGIVLYDLADVRSPEYNFRAGVLGNGTIFTAEDGGHWTIGQVQPVLSPALTALCVDSAGNPLEPLRYFLQAQTNMTIGTAEVWDTWQVGSLCVLRKGLV